MFNERAHLGLGFFGRQDEVFFRTIFHLFDRTSPLRNLPINATGRIFLRSFFALLDAHISRISMHLDLLSMQKFVGLGDVGNVGRRDRSLLTDGGI